MINSYNNLRNRNSYFHFVEDEIEISPNCTKSEMAHRISKSEKKKKL